MLHIILLSIFAFWLTITATIIRRINRAKGRGMECLPSRLEDENPMTRYIY